MPRDKEKQKEYMSRYNKEYRKTANGIAAEKRSKQKNKAKISIRHNKYVKQWRKTEAGKKSVEKAREKSKEQRAEWSRNYYIKNKPQRIAYNEQYNLKHPEVRKRAQEKAMRLGKGITKGKRERELLKDGYVMAQIRKYAPHKSIEEKRKDILKYRIKKTLSKIKKLSL